MADPFVANQENVGSLAAGRRNSDSDRDFTAKKRHPAFSAILRRAGRAPPWKSVGRHRNPFSSSEFEVLSLRSPGARLIDKPLKIHS
jgi:hypothetical protein